MPRAEQASDVGEGGELRELYEAVLPTVCEMGETITGKTLKSPMTRVSTCTGSPPSAEGHNPTEQITEV